MSIASSVDTVHGALPATLRAAPGELAPGAADDAFAPPVQPRTGFLAQLSAKASSALEVLGNSVPKRATGAGWNSIRMLIIYLSIYTATQGVFDGWDEAYELNYLVYYCVCIPNIALAQSMGVVPMMAKIIFAYPIDRLRLRRMFCSLGLALAGLCFIIKALFDPRLNFWAYVIVLMLRNSGAAFSDGATDALAIDADVEDVSGAISAWQSASRMIGLIVATYVGGVLAASEDAAGYVNCLLFLGGCFLVLLPVNLLVNEEVEPTAEGAVVEKWLNSAMTGLTLGAWQLLPPRRKRPDAKGADGAEGGAAADAEVGEGKAVAIAEPSATSSASHGDAAVVDGTALDAAPPRPSILRNPRLALAFIMSPDNAEPAAVLVRHMMKPPVFAFACYMFVSNLGTYIASFPIVPWLVGIHGFSVPQTGTLTVVGAVGYLVVSIITGYGFDYIKSKRLALVIIAILAGAAYFLFIPTSGMENLFMVQFAVSSLTGALYTAQVSMIRLMADERCAGMFAGVNMGLLAMGAFMGTFIGGAITEGGGDNTEACSGPPRPLGSCADPDDGSGVDSGLVSICYNTGAFVCIASIVFVPWITHGAEVHASGSGVGDPHEAAQSEGAGGAYPSSADADRPEREPLAQGLRPRLGSMRFYLDAGDAQGGWQHRLATAARGLFAPSPGRQRALSSRGGPPSPLASGFAASEATEGFAVGEAEGSRDGGGLERARSDDPTPIREPAQPQQGPRWGHSLDEVAQVTPLQNAQRAMRVKLAAHGALNAQGADEDAPEEPRVASSNAFSEFGVATSQNRIGWAPTPPQKKKAGGGGGGRS